MKRFRQLVDTALKHDDIVGSAGLPAVAKRAFHHRNIVATERRERLARSAGELEANRDRIVKEHGVEVVIHPGDLSDTSVLDELGRRCADVDILINNAGDIPPGDLMTVTDELWRRSWDLKVHGYIYLTRLLYPRMQERAFVLAPLLELAPDLRLPQGDLAQLLAACGDQRIERLE